MFDPSFTAQVTAHLTKLTHDVMLDAVIDQSEDGEHMRAFLEEVSGLSDRLHLKVRAGDGQERSPRFSIHPHDEAHERIVFAAVPMGHEFTSFLLAVLQVGGHPAKVDAEQIERIQALRGPLHCNHTRLVHA